MDGDLLKKSPSLTKEKLTFPDFVDNMLPNALNAAEMKCFTLFETFLFLDQSFILC